jgi:hypothetical protein
VGCVTADTSMEPGVGDGPVDAGTGMVPGAGDVPVAGGLDTRSRAGNVAGDTDMYSGERDVANDAVTEPGLLERET